MSAPSPAIGADRRADYAGAATFGEFLSDAAHNAELWHALAVRAAVPEAVLENVRRIGGQWHLLVLVEDWCGDAVNSVPVLARLADESPNLTLRVLSRDENPALMDSHLTGGKRAIPVVMILDADFREVAWWGSRPANLQQWVTTLGLSLEKPARYREIRRWYASDRGRTTLDEVVRLLCGAAGASVCSEAA